MQDSVNIELQGGGKLAQGSPKAMPTAGATNAEDDEDFSLKYPKEYHNKSFPN